MTFAVSEPSDFESKWLPFSGEASLMRVVLLFRNQRRRCESDAYGGGGSGEIPSENFEI